MKVEDNARSCPECFSAYVEWDWELEVFYCLFCGWTDFGDGDQGVFAVTPR